MKRNLTAKSRFRILAVLLALAVAISFAGCTDWSSSDEKQAQQQDELIKAANDQIGLPSITNYTEKKLMKQILELRDQSNLICYAYTQAMNGKLIYLGKCIGYGLPYSTQYTNPQKQVSSVNSDSATIPQADPNGLYMPDSAAATWLVMINEKTGKQEIMYVEPNTVVSQSKMPERLCESWSLPDNY